MRRTWCAMHDMVRRTKTVPAPRGASISPAAQRHTRLLAAEKTAFEVIKKQSSYEYWVTKSYVLLGDIYMAQKDNFNAIATYKSVAENANIEELKLEATNKLKLLVETSNN